MKGWFFAPLGMAVALAVVGCASSGASPAGSGGSGGSGGSAAASGGATSPAPTATPSGSEIAHATGATELLLRLDTGGGFIAPGFLASEAPQFSLYGDGTVIFRDDQAPGPSPVGGIARLTPFRTARPTEDQIQSVLGLAIGPGGLGTARELYMAPVADAPSTTFTLNAGSFHKTTLVVALGDTTGGEDAAARAAFGRLARQLRQFDGGGQLPTTVYAPDRYRGILIEEDQASGIGPGGIRAWPWPSLTPADWTAPAAPNAPGLPRRTMSVDEARVFGVPGFEGGLQGISLRGPGDGKLYAFALRPLLPDEPA